MGTEATSNGAKVTELDIYPVVGLIGSGIF
jgi:hypothetical protein